MIIIELNNMTVKIEEAVVNKMLEFIQDTTDKPESGGILIGFYIDDNSLTITNITTPSAQDVFSRYNFIRTKKNAQEAIDRLFKESNNKKIYLGEWHTHPENIPTPSRLDKKSILNQIKLNQLNSPIIFMIIIGKFGLYISSVKKNKMMFNKNILFSELSYLLLI
jgi:integrative and conjugative element protein (TIGR02256 family)